MSEFWRAVEAKVKAAALGTLAASLALALLNAVVGDSQLLGSLPPWLQFVLVTCAPTLVTFLTAWKTRHTAVPPVSVQQTVAKLAQARHAARGPK
jgi:hypothetical protein